jgi:hypothetical protein
LRSLFRRTSLSSLYLWGVLFGLYESWITKVTYAGYFGTAPGFPAVLGFAPVELAIIVFFWHPVMSFLLPVLAFELLSVSADRGNPLIAGHAGLLSRCRRTYLVAVVIAITGALFLSQNSRFDAGAAMATLLVTSAAVAGLQHLATRWTGGRFSVFSLALGRREFLLLLAYLALLYSVTFFFLRPEEIPLPLTLALTLCLYLAVLAAIRLDRPAEKIAEVADPSQPLIGPADLVALLGSMTILIVLLSLFPAGGIWAGRVMYLALAVIGPLITIVVIGRILRSSAKRNHHRAGA